MVKGRSMNAIVDPIKSQESIQRATKSVSFQDERPKIASVNGPHDISEMDTASVNDNDGFTLVTPRRKSSVIGTGRTTNITAITKRPFNLFISRVSPDTTSDDIMYHARRLVPNANIECVPLNTRFPTYKSFKLTVVTESIDRLLDPSNWPTGILVRKSFKPRVQQGMRPQQTNCRFTRRF